DATGTNGIAVANRNDESFSIVNVYVTFVPNCVDIRYITVSEAPTTADAGDPEIEQCNNGTFLLNANTPAVGTGTWTLVAGDPGINITNPSSPTTTVTGVPAGESATLRWTISNGTCADSFDEIILTNHAPPSTANAGLDQENCNDGNFILNANTPVSGTGTWTVISGGPSVTVVDPSDPDSDVTGVPAGVTAVLRWTISNGTCADSFDEVELTNYALPTIADAGDPEIEQCNNGTFLLNANTPDVGTGTWTLVAGDPGINITNPSSPTTTVTGVPAGGSATL